MGNDSEKVYESMDKLLNEVKTTLDTVLKEAIKRKKQLEYLDKRIEAENNNNLQLKKVLDYYNKNDSEIL